MTTTFSEILKLDWTGSSKIIAYLQPIFYFTIIEKRKGFAVTNTLPGFPET